MARPVDYRKSRGSKGVHTEDEQVPRGKTDQGRQSPAFDRDRGAPNAGCERRRSQREGRQTQGPTTASMPRVMRDSRAPARQQRNPSSFRQLGFGHPRPPLWRGAAAL